MKKVLITLMTIFSVASAVFVATPATEVKAATPVLQQGDQYGHVWDAQNRLKQLGLYKGELDGLFGPLTEQAVIDFQRSRGLIVDGIIGSNTWKALRNDTFTKNEIQMLAQVIHGEARGEPYKGKVAVAAVVLNRLHHEDFPNSIKGIIFESRAFTAVQDKQYYLTPNNESYKAAYAAIKGWDPTQNATFYFNPKTATSDWIWTREQIKQIGKHVFAK
ncbi:spore cortex-lytic enzyme [Pontibacillus marinus]|uniref:Spore cortex-lytic enzyme n=1 Tax=Pontibacillus marinus BH030004 = DSM 16465 TaxID=1385511 RepID=A0A0A5HJF6_9BACI|nr:spore cortex-lytic enzyme [Pontibacillus marinus]KGX83777.1 spore cortex-lytic protein [Pontibacillus marinus BH030004 = DSM 16465]